MAARIIVIDNDTDIRDFLTIALNDEGWEVLSYAHIHIDLAALEQLHPDLIILDLDGRESSATGWDFLQLLKMEDTTTNIPIVITTTAFQLSAEIRGYLFARYIYVVNKPFELDPFLQLIQNIVTLASQAGVLFSSDVSLPILVVEDTEDSNEALITVLRLEGYPVVTVENGLRALEAVSRDDYCLIVLDTVLSLVDGFEFLRAYERQLRPHSPVIILGAEGDFLTQRLPFFVIDVLPKPSEISYLLEIVRKYAQPA